MSERETVIDTETKQLSRQDSAPTPLERAAAYLDVGPTNTWSARSRYGRLGVLARRLIRRALKPYEIRRREFDAAILEAVVAAASSSPPQPLQVADVVEARTPVGPLWLHKGDQVMTPALLAGAVWEPKVSAHLERVLRPGMTFIDIGANIGYFSVLGAQLVGTIGRVGAVECEPGNLALLKANLWRHGCRNALVLPFAAYSRAGYLPLFLNETNRGGTAVGSSAETEMLVPCARLDDYLAGWAPDVVKVDAEGSDHVAVRGMERLLGRSLDVTLIVEFFPNVDELHGDPPAEVLEYYRALGFELFLLDSAGAAFAATDEEIFALGDREDYFNLVLRRPGARA